MGVQNLGDKKRKRCEAILGRRIRRAHTVGKMTDGHNGHGRALCWVDQNHAALVDFKNGVVLEEPTHQGCFVGWHDADG
jgi:hypothetical protein